MLSGNISPLNFLMKCIHQYFPRQKLDQREFLCYKYDVAQLATIVECSNELSVLPVVQYPEQLIKGFHQIPKML